MSHSALTRTVMKWVRRHPLAAGLALWLVGMGMGWNSFDQGAQQARFAGGAVTTGEVREITAVPGRLIPEYRMRVQWRDAAGVPRESWIPAYRSDTKRHSIGGQVELRLATDGSGGAITERLFRSRGVLRFGGAVATPLLWAAIAVMLGGVFLVATRDRFLGGEY